MFNFVPILAQVISRRLPNARAWLPQYGIAGGMLCKDARVVLCGLTAKVELNDLDGYTTDRAQSGRWGVRLDKYPNRLLVAVKPDNLRIIPCESLAEKHFLQLCAVQRLVPERIQLKKLVWSFLRVPEELVVLSFCPLESDVAGLVRVTVQTCVSTELTHNPRVLRRHVKV